LLRWIPAVFWMGLIYYFSDQTGSELSSWFPFLDSLNWGHLVAYFVLALLVYFALPRRSTGMKILAVLLCILYGITDEWHQSYVPLRQPDIYDLINDGIGAAVAMLGINVWEKRRKS
jgi:VanZ family protein